MAAFTQLVDSFLIQKNSSLQKREKNNKELKMLKTRKEPHETQRTRESEGNATIQKLLVDK